MPVIVPEHSGAKYAVETLLEHAFGPERHLKTAARLRDGNHPAAGLAFLAVDEGCIIGTLRFWPVCLGAANRALLLGPLAVDRRWQGQGVGSEMIRHGLRRARQLGHAAVILVGDAPYYERFGFRAELTCNLSLPGPVDRRRFLGLALRAGALDTVSGLVTAATPRVVEPLRRAA